MTAVDTAASAAETFGATVRRLRQEKEIGLREFARRVNISPSFLTAIEKGGCAVPEERVVAFAKALDQDVDEFLALAGQVSSDLDEYIRTHRAVATFLRVARDKNLSDEDIKTLTHLAGRIKE
jgi:HTH-type transcriptional regulator, competence development regulator